MLFSIAPSPAIIPMLWGHPAATVSWGWGSPATLLQPPLGVLPMGSQKWKGREFQHVLKSVKSEVANLTGLAAWTPYSTLILCMLRGAGDCGQAVPLLLAGQSLGGLREAVGILSRIGWVWGTPLSASTAPCPASSPRCRRWSCGPAWHLCVVACEQRADLVTLINTVSAMALAGCDLCVPKTQGGKLLPSQCIGKPPQKVGKGRVVLPTLLPPRFQSQGQAPGRAAETRTPRGWGRLGHEPYSTQIP